MLIPPKPMPQYFVIVLPRLRACGCFRVPGETGSPDQVVQHRLRVLIQSRQHHQAMKTNVRLLVNQMAGVAATAASWRPEWSRLVANFLENFLFRP